MALMDENKFFSSNLHSILKLVYHLGPIPELEEYIILSEEV